MRFNDLMQTVLSAEERSGAGAVTLWRQCVDLLAQNDRPGRPPLNPRDRGALLSRLEMARGRVSETQRIATVVELGSRLRSPTLVRFFAQDRPAICAAAMARAHLPDDVWPNILPVLGPTARGVLRGRRDLGPETRRALESFGATDLVLTDGEAREDVLELAEAAPVTDMPPQPVPAATRDEEGGQIRKLVDRIEKFKSSHRAGGPFSAMPAEHVASDQAASGALRQFSFETDAQGILVWVGEGPRAALIGLTIAEPALPGGSGPDAHVSGAFSRRSGFQNGRFTIVGGMLEGEWRVSAIPFFDPRSGRFQGYRGQARRPHLHEVPALPPEGSALAGLSADSIRQLVHELRTPLNAILGFAEIIEKQLFGPAGEQYREMAAQIMGDARHLLAAFDDLDLAARVARGEGAGEARAVDPALLVGSLASRFRTDHDQGPPRIDIAVAADLPDVRIDPAQGERMIQHFMRTMVSLARPDEMVTGACWFQPDGKGGQVLLALDRPAVVAALDEAAMLDPGYALDGDWPDASLLGLGFSLRLIRSLAASCGGRLEIDPDRFLLSMPAAGLEKDGEADAP